jgi:hypothetical protein
VAGDVPAVTERVLERPRAVAVELVLDGLELLGPGFDRLRKDEPRRAKRLDLSRRGFA